MIDWVNRDFIRRGRGCWAGVFQLFVFNLRHATYVPKKKKPAFLTKIYKEFLCENFNSKFTAVFRKTSKGRYLITLQNCPGGMPNSKKCLSPVLHCPLSLLLVPTGIITSFTVIIVIINAVVIIVVVIVIVIS